MYKTLLATTLVLALFSGCNDSIDTPSTTEIPGGYTIFDKLGGNIPFPNNILFSGSLDGTLNFDIDENDPSKGVLEALNTLDGFSTTSPISVGIDGDMDSNSLQEGLKFYKVSANADPSTGIPVVAGIERELQYGIDFIATVSDGKIVILPTRPLSSNSNYMVVLTDKITNSEGQKLNSDLTTTIINGTHQLVDSEGNSNVYFSDNEIINNGTAKQLEGLRQLNQAMNLAMLKYGNDCAMPTASEPGVTCEGVIMSWSFKTQSIGKLAQNFIDNNVSTATLELNATGISTPLQQASIYTGSLSDIPYYLGVPSEQNPTAPLTTAFSFEANASLPTPNALQTIPVIMSIPNETDTMKAPWPVVIYQHGITRNRVDMLAVADSFAKVGYATIAIDLPLHGVDKLEEPSAPFYVSGKERTFDLDFINNETGAKGPDGKIDPSGTFYMNFEHLLTARDNVRQTTSDLIALRNAIYNIKGVTVDPNRVAFVGHSLGTIASLAFITHTQMESVSLAMPGAGIIQLLNHSASKGPELRYGLSQVGIEPDSEQYNQFLMMAQTVLDDADPINYTNKMPSEQKIFSIEVVGDTSGNLPDQTIPNNAYPYDFMAGTDPLLKFLNVKDINTSILDSENRYFTQGIDTVSRFTIGEHESILRPDSATMEMQTQTASFIASQGAMIQVLDPSIIK